MGLKVNDDPLPTDPIELQFETFRHGIETLERVGFPLERTCEQAWTHYQDGRVNYEASVIFLADFVVAASAPWSGVRSHMTHEEAFELMMQGQKLNRTPDDPEGIRRPTKFRPPPTA